jgi:hypothetical protein
VKSRAGVCRDFDVRARIEAVLGDMGGWTMLPTDNPGRLAEEAEPSNLFR